MGNKILDFSSNNANSETSDLRNENEVYLDVGLESDYHETTSREGTGSGLWISKDVNVRAVMNSLRNIFSWIPGQRVLDPGFGTRLREYLYEPLNDFNIERVISEIKGSCGKWEPRVNIQKVINMTDNSDTEDNTIRLDIIFTIPSLGDEQYNYSYICSRTE